MDDNKTNSAITHFLDDVTSQISYQSLRPSIREELESHILDRVEEYETEGSSAEEAREKAIHGMGDAVTIGVELNEAHKLQKAPLLAVVSACLLLVGFAFTGYMQWMPEQSANGWLYYIPGVILLILTTYKGYPFLIRHRKMAAGLLGVFYLAQIGDIAVSRYKGYMFGPVNILYFAILMFVPVITIVLYCSRQSRKKILVAALGCAGVWLLLSFSFHLIFKKTAVLIFLLSTAGTVCFMINRNIISGRKKYLYSGVLVSLVMIGSPLVLSESGRNDLKAFIDPGSAVHSTWDDAYNNILIQELLSRTPLVHSLELSSKEMMDYGTGAWYFASRDPLEIGVDATGIQTEEQQQAFHEKVEAIREQGYFPKYIQFTEENVTVWDILPQHYHNNYLIAVCIFMFGWLPGMVLVGGIVAFYMILFTCIKRIRGQLASCLAFSCGQILLWQGVFYLLGNFGYQYSSFPNMPLISEGRISIVFNMLLLGLVFSAYRYDRVGEYLRPAKLLPSGQS